jgi:hypothetical protein
VRHGQVDTGLGVEVLPVAAGPAADALLVLCALQPVVGRAVMDLMSFAGNQIEVLNLALTLTLTLILGHHPTLHRHAHPSPPPPCPCTLHPAPCTLHPAPCTLYPHPHS